MSEVSEVKQETKQDQPPAPEQKQDPPAPEKEPCCICLEPCVEKTPCNHYMHKRCLARWEKNSCPMCRRSIVKERAAVARTAVVFRAAEVVRDVIEIESYMHQIRPYNARSPYATLDEISDFI